MTAVKRSVKGTKKIVGRTKKDLKLPTLQTS